MSRSRPHWTEYQDIDHLAQRGADDDLVSVMKVEASNAQLSMEELKHFKEAQKTNEELQEVFSKIEEQLQSKKLKISPQGILYRVEGDGWLMVVPKVLQQKIIREKPRRPSYWTRGTQQNCGPYQKSFLVAWYVEHRGRIRVILSGLPVGEIRPQEKGGSIAANPTTGAEMATDYDRLGH